MNKPISLLILLNWTVFLVSFSQKSALVSLKHAQSNSYISYDKLPNNFDEEILTELSLQHNFYLHYDNFLPKFYLEINPEMTIRMLDSTFSALPPKFNIDLNIYRQLSSKKGQQFAFLGFGHHSNGQDFSFFKAGTEEINLANGDFATDYFNLGYLKETQNRFYFLQAYYIQIHPGFFKNSRRTELYTLYNEYRLGGKWQWIASDKLQKNRFSATGALQVLLEDIDKGQLLDKLIIDVKLAYQPHFFKMPHFWVFLQAYFGEDYYQIYFHRQIAFLRTGITIRPWN